MLLNLAMEYVLQYCTSSILDVTYIFKTSASVIHFSSFKLTITNVVMDKIKNK